MRSGRRKGSASNAVRSTSNTAKPEHESVADAVHLLDQGPIDVEPVAN